MTASGPAFRPAALPKTGALPKPLNPQPGRLRPVPDGLLVPSLVGLYLFLYYSRVLDVSELRRLHIPMVLLIILTLLALIQGEGRRLFASRLGLAVVSLTGWVCFCLPFSTWIGGSIESVKLALQSFAVFLVVVALVRSFESWLKIAYAVGFSVAVAACLSFVFGKEVQGRVAFAEGINADPNQFALVLLMGLPFLWLMANRSTRFSAVRIFALLATVPVLVAFFRAGSRAGLLCLAAMAAVMFVHATPLQKLKLAVLGIIIAASAFVWLPSYLRVRFFTLFSTNVAMAEELDEESLKYMGGDIGSTHGRRQLLEDGIRLTLRHPLFGVGPGQFAYRNWDEARKRGQRRASVVNHNTYVQYSSETGVAGFIAYSLALFFALFDLLRIRRQAKLRAKTSRDYQQFVTASQYLIASVVSFAVGSFFLSLAYSIVVYSMFALVAAFCLTVRTVMAINNPRPAAAPAPRPAAGF